MTEYLSPSDIVRYVDLSMGSILKAIHQGMLKAKVSEDGYRLIPLEDAIRFAREQHVDASPLLRMRKKRILVVDDDYDFMVMLLDVLSSDVRLLCKTVSSLFEARHALQEFKPHLVIVDANLPDGYGWTLLDDIPADNPAGRPVFFGISALSSKSTVKEMTNRGAAMCLAKPVDPDTLLSDVRTTLNLEPSTEDNRVNSK